MTTIYTAAQAQPVFHVDWRPASSMELLTKIYRAYGVARQRRHLKAMSDHQLADIAVSRADADAEAARGFWDIPSRQFPNG